MAVAAVDTQHGATAALSSDSLSLRVTKIAPAKSKLVAVPTSHHGTTTRATYMPGDLLNGEPIAIEYQNSPTLGNPTAGTVQTLTLTGPTPGSGSSGETIAITGFVTEVDDLPEYAAANGTTSAPQMKTFVFHPDGTTRTRTAAS